MNKNEDFFFGNAIKKNECNLYNLLDISKRVSANYFNEQLNRVLESIGGVLIITDSTSSPSFAEFMNKLSLDSIGKIEIESRNDINTSVDATLACSIWLPNGVCHIRPHWCAYKKNRADEIISTLVVPLYLMGLEKKAYIQLPTNDFQSFCEGIELSIDSLFLISKYRIYDKSILNSYIEVIRRASEAFQNSNDYCAAKKLYKESSQY